MRLHDPKTLAPRHPSSSGQPSDAVQQAEQAKVRQGIESMFVRQMLEASHMFDGVGGHPMMQGMMMEKLAESVAQGGNLGIGDLVTGTQKPTVAPPSVRGLHPSQPMPAQHPHVDPHVEPHVGKLGSADELDLLKPTRGLDHGWSMNMGDFSLPDDLLPRAAKDALRDGRVPGLGANASVDLALQRAWQPVQGTPQGETGVIPLAQADSVAQLGTGGQTIRQAGCLLTSLTMVSNTLTGRRTPVELANRLVTAGGGFAGSNLQVGKAGAALGLRLADRASFTGDTSAIDAALAAGRPVIAGVDHEAGTSSALGRSDHFLVLTGRTGDGGYSAIDAADGRPLTFRPDGEGTMRAGRYALSEFMTLLPAQQAPTVVARAPRSGSALDGLDLWTSTEQDPLG